MNNKQEPIFEAQNFSETISENFNDTGMYESGSKHYPGRKRKILIKRLAIAFSIAVASTLYMRHELKHDDDWGITWSDHVRSAFNKNLKKNGHGILVLGENSKYVGKFIDGKPEGYGVQLYVSSGDAYRYQGDFKNGMRDGWGISEGAIYDSKYQGYWAEDKKNGHGTMTWSDGAKYSGNWVDDEPKNTEWTKITWPDGREYKGQINLHSGQPHGKGALKNVNGSSYSGQWTDGKYHGRGVFKFPSGSRYEGDFSNGWKHGKGTYYWSYGSSYRKYSGEWFFGDMEGSGTLIKSNGDRYMGQWKNDKPNGKGTYKYANGKTESGDWSNGCLDGFWGYDCDFGLR